MIPKIETCLETVAAGVKAAVIIDGPEEVLNSNDENNPKITDNKPPIIE